MRDLRRRLEQLEYGRLYQLAAKVGQPYGFSADQVFLDEARSVLVLPEAGQDTELTEALAQAQARSDHEAVHLLTQGWAAIRSYR